VAVNITAPLLLPIAKLFRVNLCCWLFYYPLVEVIFKKRRFEMKRTKILAIVLTGLLTLLVSSKVYSVTLQESIQDQMSPPNQDFSSAATIPYMGNLTDKGGNPVEDGIYAFKFFIYESQNQEEPLWSEAQEGVEVENGVFNVQLGSVQHLPVQALQSEHLLLQVAVRGPGDNVYTALNPPQVLQSISASAPASINAHPACAHDHMGEEWINDNLNAGLTIKNSSDDFSFPAILGESTNFYGGVGIAGHASGGHGLEGISENNIGVYGSSTYDTGVYGKSSSLYGVSGYSSSEHGGYFSSGNDHLDLMVAGNIGRINAAEYDGSKLYLSSNADLILKLDNDGGEEHVLRVKESSGTDVCTINESGDLWCAGTISEGASTAQHGERLLYPIGSPEVLFEDFGMGTLENGEAHIEFEQIFAETVNLGENYHVFLTPVCDQPLVLNVSAKTPSGFKVQGVTLDGTPSNCTFDYRIVAKRLGYESLRLERVSTDLEETN